MGQKKVNKANDAFGLKKSREQSNKKNDTNFNNKQTHRLNQTAVVNTFLKQLKEKNIQQKEQTSE